jgi:hypothetical protein
MHFTGVSSHDLSHDRRGGERQWWWVSDNKAAAVARAAEAALMATADIETPIDRELTELVMNCPELTQLEARLVRFNIFRILRADRAELRHSNMLAWLFQPDEGHGFGESFLRRWLMRIMRDAEANPPAPPGWVSPIVVDTIDIEYVEVTRELESIDLLMIIHRQKGRPWVVCIENKVESAQHTNQLDRYHSYIENRFADAERRIYVLLSKHGELPENAEFIQSSYEEVVRILNACLDEHQASIGSEPRLLLNHYRQLLVDDFMNENDASRLARQIYLRHKRVIDFIIENKIDPIYQASNALYHALQQNAAELGIIMDVLGKGWVRFIPMAWDVPTNKGGSAWGVASRYLLCEVGLWSKKAELHITIGKAPSEWADKVWSRAASPPFKQEWKKRPSSFVKPYKAKSDISLDSLEGLEEEEIGDLLLNWLKLEMQKPQFREAVQVLATLLPNLGASSAKPLS